MRQAFVAFVLCLCACVNPWQSGQSSAPPTATPTSPSFLRAKANGFPVVHLFVDNPPGNPDSQQAMFVESGTETCMPFVFDNGHNSEVVWTSRSGKTPAEGTATPRSASPSCTQVSILANTYWDENRLSNGGLIIRSDGTITPEANVEAFAWYVREIDGSIDFHYATNLVPHNCAPGCRAIGAVH